MTPGAWSPSACTVSAGMAGCAGTRQRPAPGARAGFTLVEMLLVLLIISLVLGMVESLLGPRAIRGAQVRDAAMQLASVLRQARQLAMDHHGFYGVSFNIENAPGSSGSILNNRSGGHWYRIIGPHDPDWQGGWADGGGYDVPEFFNRSFNPTGTPFQGDTELGGWLNLIQKDFVGPKFRLPRGQARFIALTDEDDGNYNKPSAAFGPTYPRPWFGEFVRATGDAAPRLYAWGGYECGNRNFCYGRAGNPACNYSGFYFQGDDPPISGCVNPANRFIIDSPGTTVQVNDPLGATAVQGKEDFALFTQGQVRPLINGDWLDCVILFNPDGTASMNDWMSMRHQYGQTGFSSNGNSPMGWWRWNDWAMNLAQLGPGDMCNFSGLSDLAIPYNTRYEASNYEEVTGMYYITIGADAIDDTVSFADAGTALASMMPLYRVGVSRLGEIMVVKVRTAIPDGVALDAKWQQDCWSSPAIGDTGYWNNLALSQTGQQLMPAEDFVTTGMMECRQWWIDP